MSLGSTAVSEWQHDYFDAEIHHSAVVHPDTVVGKGVKIGANCVIGFDGFNYERDKNFIPKLKKHYGVVVIGDNVEVHSCVCIDRGETTNTIIGDNVKIDNLVHIAHDVFIGKNSYIVAGSSLGGYVTIGKNCFLGINVSVKPKVKIGNYCMVGMASVLLNDIPDNEVWAGNPARKIRNNEFFKGV